MTNNKAPADIRSYIAVTYVIFWVLLGITGFLIFLKAPVFIQNIFKNVCAWSATFAVLILFRRLYPGKSLREFLRWQFAEPPKPWLFLAALAVQTGLAILAMLVHSALTGGSLKPWSLPPPSVLVPMFFWNLTSGPLGEELGWRGYALRELCKTRSPAASGVVIGLAWGFWHFPLWLMSGFAGLDLLYYVLAFMVAIVSVSVIMAQAMEWNRNILVAVWLHFWFNFLMQLAGIDLLPLMAYAAVGYGALALGMTAFGGRRKDATRNTA